MPPASRTSSCFWLLRMVARCVPPPLLLEAAGLSLVSWGPGAGHRWAGSRIPAAQSAQPRGSAQQLAPFLGKKKSF